MNVLKRNTLGRTGLEVSELCLGTLTMSYLQAGIPPESTEPVFQKALAMGIDFFDTAHRYRTDEHVRLGLGQRLGDVTIATKISAATIEEAETQLAETFTGLGRQTVEIMLMHQVESADAFEARRPVLDRLLELKRDGRIRAVGFSTHTIAGCEAALANADRIDVLMPVINRRGLGIADGSLSRQSEVLAEVHRAGVGIYAMKPLAGGLLRKEAVEALNFVRGLEFVDSVCVGVKTVQEVELNAAIFSDGQLEISRQALDEAAHRDRRVFVNFMCKRCGACAERCDQGAMTMGGQRAEVDPKRCILCGYCAEVCPQFAIRVI